MRTGRSFHKTVSVDVDVDIVLDELTDEELLAEVKRRALTATAGIAEEDLDDLRHALLRGDLHEALILFDRAVGTDAGMDAAALYRRASKRGDTTAKGGDA